MYAAERWADCHNAPVEYQLFGCDPRCVHHSVKTIEDGDTCPVCGRPYTRQAHCWRCAIDESYRAHRTALELQIAADFDAELQRQSRTGNIQGWRLRAINKRFATPCLLLELRPTGR